MTNLAQLFDPEVKFVDIPPFWAGALAISLVAGAYLTEIFRGAFLGADPGTIDCARALGLKPLQIFFLVRFRRCGGSLCPASATRRSR